MPPAGLRKAKGHAAKVLKAAEPQLLEGDKKLLFLRGEHPSALGVAVAKDLLALKKPDVHRLTRRNEVRPFEDAAPLEFLSEKAGCAAFLLATHNKKRPHNLVLGRIFASHVLDLVELGVAAHAPLSAFAGSKKALAAPPLLVFAGAEWAAGSAAAPDLALVRASLLDVFAARDRPGVALQGLDHVLLVAVEGALIHFRGYFMSFKRSDTRVPRVALSAMGPFVDFTLRRVQHSSAALEKEAMRQPAQNKKKKVKNVSTDALGETVGRLHMERQDYDKLELKKNTKAWKADKRRRRAGDGGDGADAAAAGAGGDDGEDDGGGDGGDGGGDGDDAAPAAAKRPRREAS